MLPSLPWWALACGALIQGGYALVTAIHGSSSRAGFCAALFGAALTFGFAYYERDVVLLGGQSLLLCALFLHRKLTR